MISIKIDKNNIKRIARDWKRQEDKIWSKAINSVSKTAVVQAVKFISADHGYKSGTLKKGFSVYPKAKPSSLSASVNAKGYRMQYPGRLAIMRKKKMVGVSFLKEGRVRVRKMDKIKTGSKPFLFRGRHHTENQAKLIGYISNDNARGKARKITALQGSSVANLFGKVYERKVNKIIRDRLPIEYARASARYRS